MIALVYGVHRYSQFVFVEDYSSRHPDVNVCNIKVKVPNTAVAMDA